MHEDLLLIGIRREQFYEKIGSLKLNLKDVFKNNTSCNKTMKESFNIVLMKLKSKFEFDIIESVLFLEEDWASMHYVVSMLDGDTIEEVKKELRNRNNIKSLNLTKFEKFGL